MKKLRQIFTLLLSAFDYRLVLNNRQKNMEDGQIIYQVQTLSPAN